MELTFKAKILLIDDSPEVRLVVSRILRKAGYEVIEARTGADGISSALTEQPDAIILDVNLPDMTGFDVCKLLKTNPVTLRIPVIYLSAIMATVTGKIEGLQAGAEAYLSKPLEPGVLFATIALVLRLRRSENQLALLSAHWETAFQGAEKGICLTDEKGFILRENRKFHTLLGLQKQEMTGVSWRDVAVRAGWAITERTLDAAERSELRIGALLSKQGRSISVKSDLLADATERIIGAVHELT